LGLLLCGFGGGDLFSIADFRAPTFSLRVTRDDVGLDDEFELFMQLLGTYFNWLRCSRCVRRRISRVLDLRIAALTVRSSDHARYCTQCKLANTARYAGRSRKIFVDERNEVRTTKTAANGVWILPHLLFFLHRTRSNALSQARRRFSVRWYCRHRVGLWPPGSHRRIPSGVRTRRI
jgi:hypothetical protein